MTDTTRDLLISLASHMAYMQGQLEARHELDDPEDYYWYRESVLLRQKVTDALADEPAVPAPPAELSPEAQAVSDAVKKISPASADEIAAAALRAAAKRVGPSEILPPGYAYSAPAEELYYQFRLREMNKLLGVAAELDLCQPGPGRAGAGGEQ